MNDIIELERAGDELVGGGNDKSHPIGSRPRQPHKNVTASGAFLELSASLSASRKLYRQPGQQKIRQQRQWKRLAEQFDRPRLQRREELRAEAMAATQDVAAQLAGREPPPPDEDLAEAEALSADDLALWREQQARHFADGNIDMADLCDASSLPTLLKLLAIPSVAAAACGTISEIAAGAAAAGGEGAAPVERRAGQTIGALAALLGPGQSAAPVVIAAVGAAAAHLARLGRCRAWIWSVGLVQLLGAAAGEGDAQEAARLAALEIDALERAASGRASPPTAADSELPLPEGGGWRRLAAVDPTAGRLRATSRNVWLAEQGWAGDKAERRRDWPEPAGVKASQLWTDKLRQERRQEQGFNRQLRDWQRTNDYAEARQRLAQSRVAARETGWRR